MKALFTIVSGVMLVGVLTALGMHAPATNPSVEYQPKPGSYSQMPRVMQDANCTPTPPDSTPGGHPKKPKAASTPSNK